MNKTHTTKCQDSWDADDKVDNKEIQNPRHGKSID